MISNFKDYLISRFRIHSPSHPCGGHRTGEYNIVIAIYGVLMSQSFRSAERDSRLQIVLCFN